VLLTISFLIQKEMIEFFNNLEHTLLKLFQLISFLF